MGEAPVRLKVFQAAYHHGSLQLSMYEALIAVLPKPDKIP